MSQQNTLALISEEDYLEGEKCSEIKHEYMAGRIFAMSGTSRAHNRIASNFLIWLNSKTANTPCETYMADVKLRIAHRQTYYYPDVMLGCDPDDDNDYYLERPCLVVEVLSSSTETTDRREKLLAYQTIPSLQAYLLVAQDRCRIERYTPLDAQHWQHTVYTAPDEQIELPCVEAAVSVAALYAGVKLN